MGNGSARTGYQRRLIERDQALIAIPFETGGRVAEVVRLRQFRVVQTLGTQPQHVGEGEARMIHFYRKHMGMSIHDLAYVLKRSSSTIHNVLKKPVEIPSKEEIAQMLK